MLPLGTPAPGGLNFTVGSSSGLVEASGTLDRELFSRYTLTVEVWGTACWLVCECVTDGPHRHMSMKTLPPRPLSFFT